MLEEASIDTEDMILENREKPLENLECDSTQPSLYFQLDCSPSLQSRPILSSSTWGCYVYYCIAQFIIIILIIINTV